MALAALLCCVGGLPAAGPVNPKAEELKESWASEVVSLKLLRAVEEAANKGAKLRDVMKNDPVQWSGDGLLVEIVMDQVAIGTEKQFAIPGVKVTHTSPEWRRVTVELTDPAAVYTIAKIPGVRMVRPVYGMKTNVGAVTSQAVRAMNVTTASNRYGVNGSGQKVGVISDSFAVTSGVRDGNTSPAAGAAGTLTGAKNQDSGDLPASVQILKDDTSGADEGAGMAELIHDIVPGAAIAFHTAIGGQSVFADGITALRGAGCSVIVDDIIYFAEPMYQDGTIAKAARNSVAAGVPYFSAAGNDKNNALRFNYRDFDPNNNNEGTSGLPTTVDLHLWDNGTAFLPISVVSGDTVIAVVQWNQPNASVSPGNGSQIDIDAYMLLNPQLTGANVISGSNDIQGTTGSPSGDAFEIVGVFNPTSSAATVYLALDHFRGSRSNIPQNASTPLEIRIVFFGFAPRVDGITSDTREYGGPSIYGHTVAGGAVAVGAVPWYDTPNFNTEFGPTTEMDAQDFTSLGGNLSVLFNDSGDFSPRNVFKPEIAATNGENTTFFGFPLNLQGYDGEPDAFPNFFGTSAAAPNAAAVAALMKSLNPALTPAQITEIMAMTATDVRGRRAGTGVDDTTGAGLVNALAAIDEVALRGGINPVVTPTRTPTPRQIRIFTKNPAPDIFNPEDPSQESFDPWAFFAPDGFSAPTSSESGGSRVVSTTNNTNTFGYLLSPYFIAGVYQQTGDRPLSGNNGPTNLYRAKYTVRSSLGGAEADSVPTMRLRVTTENNEQSDLVVVTSNLAADNLSPTSSARSYRVFFALPSTQDRFRLFFEVLNFGGADAANASFLIDRVDVLSVTTTSLTDQRGEKVYDFAGANSLGWAFRNAFPAFARPDSAPDSNGLRLGPATEVNPATNTFFGYFSSPEGDAGAARFSNGRLYRAVFRVATNASAGQKAQVPTFRLRMNDGSLNLSALMNIESISAASRLPVSGTPVDYALWFESQPEVSDNPMIFAFDYLLVAGAGNGSTLTLTLERLSVDSFLSPVF